MDRLSQLKFNPFRLNHYQNITFSGNNEDLDASLCHLRWLPTVVEKWQRKIMSSQRREIICYLCKMGNFLKV